MPKTAPPRFIFLLNSAQRRLQQWIAAQQADAALSLEAVPTAAQSAVLFLLDKSDGASMGDIAQRLDLVPSAVSGLIKRLEALDWVQRQACAADARAQRVWLRPAGRALVPVLQQALTRINAQLSQGFSAEELKTVARWLEHVQQLDPSSTGVSRP